MKSVPFDYVRPKTLESACSYLSKDPNSLVLAGGQSLLPMLSMRLARPSILVDIAHIKELQIIENKREIIKIGSMVRQADALKNPVIKKYLPLLIKGLNNVGHPPTRARGTIGGSIAQADPSSEIALVAVTLGAVIKVYTNLENVEFLASEFFLGPMMTAIPDSGCIFELNFPKPSARKFGTGFNETAPRKSDYALASASAYVDCKDTGDIDNIKLGIGGVGDFPQLIEFNQHWDRKQNKKSITNAIKESLSEVDFVSDYHASSEYRKRAVIELAYQSFLEALGEIGKENNEN